MVLKTYFVLVVLFFSNVKYVECDCTSYSGCIGSFISNFFGNVNYFKSANSDEFNDTISDFGEENINNILADVSSFLQSEIENNETIDTHHIFQNINNDTSIFLKTFNIPDDIDSYNNIFFENQTFELPGDISITNFDSPDNESGLIRKDKNNSFLLQPLFFNFSEILVPVNFTVSQFPQIKIEHFQPINAKDERTNEIIDDDFNEYYDFNEDNTTDYPIIDYIDLYKDTTNEATASISTERYENANEISENKHFDEGSIVEIKKYEDKGANNKDTVNITSNIYPWIAAIFIKNGTSDQFNYYCDGALLSNNTVLTAARCIRDTNFSVKADDIIVILGKKSLQAMGENEKVTKIRDIHVHENFTSGSNNDVAILTLEDAVEFSESIQPGRLGNFEQYDDAYTTGWAFTGELSLVHFQQDNKNCYKEVQVQHTFCATYDEDVTACPSYGGLYMVKKNDTWYLQGLRTADPSDRVICFNKQIVFTSLEHFFNWISDFVNK